MSHAPHWDATYHHVIWECIEDEPPKVKPHNPDANKDIRFNRAQRRHLQRYIARKARLQMRVVYKKHPELHKIAVVKLRQHCDRCELAFLGSSGDRCQCQPQQCHKCAMCHETYMASQAERRFTNMCPECAKEFQRQLEAEQARKYAAMERYDELRVWDEGQQRIARECNDEY